MLFGLAAYVVGAVFAFGPLAAVIRLRPGRAHLVTSIAWALLFGLPYLFLFGVPYTLYLANAGRCLRPPAVASNFAAGYTYRLPGDLDYAPGPFDSAYFCTAAEAERQGYRRTPFHG